MPVQIDYTPQLEQKEIYDFVVNVDTHFDSPQPTENGYSFIESRNAGTEQTSLFISAKETYNVIDGAVIVSNFDVVIPIEQPVTITIKSNLLIIDTLTDQQLRTKIITAFRNYDPNGGVDVDDYVNQELSQEPLLNEDMFTVSTSFMLDKNGQTIEHRNQANAILSLYNDINGSGTISLTAGSNVVTGNGTLFKTELCHGISATPTSPEQPGSIIQSTTNVQLGIVDKIISDTELKLKQNAITTETNIGYHIGFETEFFMVNETNLSRFFRRRGLRAVLIQPREYLQVPYNPPHDPIHQIESSDEADIDEIVHHDSAGLECGELVVEKIKIARVPTLPEFKTEIVWRMVKIGCIKTLLPWFHKTQVRFTYVTLFAAVGHRRNLDSYILHRITSCAEGAAISSAVIGIWLGNFASALVAFKALFVQCIESFIEEEVNCIIPDLVTMSEKGQWEDV